jgi:hypothetical protein
MGISPEGCTGGSDDHIEARDSKAATSSFGCGGSLLKGSSSAANQENSGSTSSLSTSSGQRRWDGFKWHDDGDDEARV